MCTHQWVASADKSTEDSQSQALLFARESRERITVAFGFVSMSLRPEVGSLTFRATTSVLASLEL